MLGILGGTPLNLVERSLRLEATHGLGARPRPELVGPVLAGISDALLDAVRMGFRHSSRAPGRVPASLRAAADVRYLGLEGQNDTASVLHFGVPRFDVAAAELFKQGRLWNEGPQPEDTAFELLGSALRDIGGRVTDSSSFDRGILRRVRAYDRLLDRGLRRIEMPDTVSAHRGHVDRGVVDAARELLTSTPRPRRVRVMGRLDTIAVSQAVMRIEVTPGMLVTATWEGQGKVDAFRSLLNEDVVAEGQGVFRPSGTLLRVDVDALAPATARDEAFRFVPFAPALTVYGGAIKLRPGEHSSIASIIGRIPGEESDEVFAAAVDQLS